MQLFLQLRNFGLLFAVLLGSSMFGLILMLFLGLGKIADSAADPSYGAQLSWLYLLLQSVMFSAIKHAILSCENRAFQYQLVKRSWCVFADLKLLLLSHGWLLASLLIAIDLNLQQWLKVPHFAVFILVQIGLGVVCLYKPSKLTVGFLLSAIWVLLPISLSPLEYQIGLVILFIVSFYMPIKHVSLYITVNSLTRFWLLYFCNHYWQLLWRLALMLCVYVGAYMVIMQRGDLADIISLLVLCFIVLLSSSLQFDCQQCFYTYRAFFAFNGQKNAFYISQFIPSVLLCLIGLVGVQVFLPVSFKVQVFFIVPWVLLQLLIAHKKPAHYALVWITIGAGVVAFN